MPAAESRRSTRSNLGPAAYVVQGGTGTGGGSPVTLSGMKMLLSWLGPVQLPADTVVTIAARDGFDVLIAIAAALIAATFLAVLLGLLYVFHQSRQAVRAVERMRRQLLEDPGVESMRRAASHIEAVSEVIQEEVTELTRSLGTVSERLQQASDRMEERIEEFNALVKVVQLEAEGVFLDTASTARGVRSGVRKGLEEQDDPDRRDPDGRSQAPDSTDDADPQTDSLS